MEVAGAAALQEVSEATHGDAEGVDRLVPMMLCGRDDVLVLPVQVLDLSLEERSLSSYFYSLNNFQINIPKLTIINK